MSSSPHLRFVPNSLIAISYRLTAAVKRLALTTSLEVGAPYPG